MVVFDLLLDPAAIALGYWQWFIDGMYYGIPALNYLGWFLSSYLASLVLYFFVEEKLPLSVTSSATLSVSFFLGVALSLEQAFPIIFGAALIHILFYMYWHHEHTASIIEKLQDEVETEKKQKK